MNYLKGILPILLACFSLTSFSQMDGNQSYGRNSSSYNRNVKKQTVTTTDSTLVIRAKILMNKEADMHLVSFGVNQEGETVAACNGKINKRIEALIKSFKSLEISEGDCYVDFVSQTKVYDYAVEVGNAEQIEQGFEIKKNVHVKVDDLGKMDQLIELCAAQEIYDVIKAEYLNNDVEQTYTTLYDEAVSFIESRKNLYMRLNSHALNGDVKVISDNFYVVAPKNSYLSYQAFESSALTVHNRNQSQNYVRKEARKNKTRYYNGMDHSGFDKVINSTTPVVGNQYVLELVVVYGLEK